MSGSSLYNPLSFIIGAALSLSIALVLDQMHIGTFSMVFSGLSLALLLGATWLSLKLQKRTAAVADICQAIAGGDLEKRITCIRERGAFGRLLWSINSIIDRSDAFIRESNATIEKINQNKYYRRMMTEGMAGMFLRSANTFNENAIQTQEKVKQLRSATQSFESNVAELVEQLIKSSIELQATSGRMQTASKSTTDRIYAVAQATQSASENVNNVAAAAEEMTASIDEISSKAAQSRNIAIKAVEVARTTNETVIELSENARKIGDIVGMINSIAEQTNLLALNATIEAARAGEAGRGFAVVAQDVKTLSQQTASATEQISEQIRNMQGIAHRTTSAIEEVSSTIDRISEAVTGIAAAAEEQATATAEIAKNVQEAAGGVNEVTLNVNAVSDEAKQSNLAADQVLNFSDKLAEQMNTLKRDVMSLMQDLQKVV